MSKFTRALSKVQEEREDKDALTKSNGGTLKVPAAETITAERGSWDRGVTVIKNADLDPRIVTLKYPDSMVAEQYRMLRTSLKNQLSKDQSKVILVSSSIHSEGKTVTSTNLAVALAENGDAKVILLDADLRRGKVSEYLGFGNHRTGLSNLLTSNISPKQIMVRNSLNNLVVMPRGPIMKKPSELVSSSKFHALISELRSHFDYIIIDAPPIMSVADAGILARFADGVLFVVQVGRTPKSVIEHAQLLFKQAGTKIFGYVLTNVEYQSTTYRYYNYYYAEDPEKPNPNIKEKAVGVAKDTIQSFRNLEDKFNEWWEKRVLKNAKSKGNGSATRGEK